VLVRAEGVRLGVHDQPRPAGRAQSEPLARLPRGGAGVGRGHLGPGRPLGSDYRLTLIENSRRVEMPASGFSPSLRARTKIAINCWCWLAGKPASVRKLRSA
jgi:hypothetical protein